MFDLADFGAALDGVTNDDAAFALALAAAIAVGGGIIYHPGGTLLTNNGLSWSANTIHLLGAGCSVSKIKLASGGSHVVEFGGSGSSVRGLELDGNAAGGGTGHCIRMHDTKHLIADCYLHDADGYGIGAGQQAGSTVQHCTFRDLIIENSGDDGLDIKNRSNTNRGNTIRNVIVDGYDLSLSGSKAGIDCRGPVLVSNVEVRGSSSLGAGVRFRGDGSGGLGGKYSKLVNANIYGAGSANSRGMIVEPDGVAISNTTVIDHGKGFSVSGRAMLENVVAENADVGFEFGVGSAFSSVSNGQAIDCDIAFRDNGNMVMLANCQTISTASGIGSTVEFARRAGRISRAMATR